MLILNIILLIIGILLFIYSLYSLKHTKQINNSIIKQNEEIENKNKELREETIALKNNYDSLSMTKVILNNAIEKDKERLKEIQSTINSSTKAKEELSKKAFENYCEVLDKQYNECEEEYNQYKDALETAYANRQLELLQELDRVQKDLTQIKATRTAAIQAQTREKEIEEKLSFYCLTIPESDIKDIGVLEAVAPKLSKPRILWMLIWQTFFRTPMTTLCNQVIGTTVKSGIYKITNIKTKECYIGQAIDLASRWKDHAKCGLHIDTPAGNKLYQAMQEYGIWNFSWEILEEVPPALLDEKEKYYIDLYDAKNFGYNKTQGNSR